MFARYVTVLWLLQAMLHRLRTVKPKYQVTEWVEDWQRNAKLAEMITTFPTTTLSCKASCLVKLCTSRTSICNILFLADSCVDIIL